MENLLRQREELLGKIRRIAEACEGLENEENARRVTELNARQAELLAQKDELKNKLSALDGELGTIGKNISDLSGSGIEKILQAIKNQRWYFFKNKPKVLMDRDTAIIWADLNYFPYGKNNNQNGYLSKNCFNDITNFMVKINSNSWSGFNDWKIPTPFELWKMVVDKSFPFQRGDNWRIMNWIGWCVEYNANISGKNLDSLGATSKIFNDGGEIFVLPCSHAYVPTDYENNISPSNNFYTETEKLQFTLNVFVQNDLIPLFNDEAITHLYRKIFVEKPALLKQLAEVEAQIAENSQVKLTANFNYRPILAKFDVAAINKSVIKYSDAVIKLTDELLDILQEYETAQAATIAEFLPLSLKLNAQFKESPDLTPEEVSFFKRRQQFLAQRLDFGFEAVEEQINSVKAQAEFLAAQIDRINRGRNAIRELAELQAEPRADFELLTENLAQIILDTQRRVDLFLQNKTFVTNIVNTCAAWNENYKAFKINLRGDFKNACDAAGIDPKISGAWYDDWQKKRFAIEQKFSSLVQFVIDGHFFNGIYDILGNFQRYKENVDKFYLEERVNIYKKFATAPDGDLQEKFETEIALYKLAEKFYGGMQKIILLSKKMDGNNFLLRWAESLRKIPLGALNDFIRDSKFNAISEETLTQFAALIRQSFAAYPSDPKAFDEELQRHEKEFDALISRMLEELHKP